MVVFDEGTAGRSQEIVDWPRMLPLERDSTPTEFRNGYIAVLGESCESLRNYAMRHALKLTRGHRADANDLVQEAFGRILGRPFDKRVNGRACLTTILTRLHIDTLRRRSTLEKKLGSRVGFEIAMNEGAIDRTVDDPSDIAVTAASASAFSAEIRCRISTLISAQSDEQRRDVFRALVDFDHGELRSTAEIQRMTGLKHQQIKKLRAPFVELAREALKDLMEPPDIREIV